MKYFSAALFGIVVGIALGVVVLYFNPLTTRSAPSVEDAALTLRYSMPERDLLALTHYEGLPLPFKPEGVDSLWEKAIRSAALSVLALHDEAGDAAALGSASEAGEEGAATALATRLTMPSPETDLLLRGALLDDYWLVTVPGGGSLFVHDVNNLWPALRENVVRVSLLDRPWGGPAEYRTTLGPRAPRGPGFAIGATGRFRGLLGEAAERYRLNRYSRARGAEDLAGELELRLPVIAEEAPITN